MQNIDVLLKMWTLRNLTLKGKIQIINTLVIPQLLYIGTVMHMPKTYLEEIKKWITNIIWNGKPSKVKYSTLINTIEDGGLALQDVECKLNAIKIKWIQNIYNENYTAPWQKLSQYQIQMRHNYVESPSLIIQQQITLILKITSTINCFKHGLNYI